MGNLELFALIGLGTLIAMLCWGKIYDRGLPTDRERVIYPDGPECDDDENLADISSPFEYEDYQELTASDVSESEELEQPDNIEQSTVNGKKEVRLDEYLKNKSGADANSH